MPPEQSCLNIDQRKQATDWHEKANQFLLEHDIPPSSICHLVAYEYFSHRHPQLNQRINQQLHSDNTLDDYFLRDLFEEFCLNRQEGRSNEHIADLQQLLFKVLEGFQQGSDGTEAYGKLLEQQTAALNTDPSLADLKQIAGNLLDATQQAIADNQRISEHLRSAEQHSQQLQEEVRQLQAETEKDPLTGLFNRRALTQRLSGMMGTAVESGEPLVLCMFDIDHFKRFNDTYGHPVGDQVIKLVSKTLQDKSRSSDLAVRYGGEEFTLLLPGTPMNIAMQVASRIHQSVASLTLVKRSTKEQLPSVTISMGLASLQPGDDDESLINRADQALYHAKQNGRNRIVTEQELDVPNKTAVS